MGSREVQEKERVDGKPKNEGTYLKSTIEIQDPYAKSAAARIEGKGEKRSRDSRISNNLTLLPPATSFSSPFFSLEDHTVSRFIEREL